MFRAVVEGNSEGDMKNRLTTPVPSWAATATVKSSRTPRTLTRPEATSRPGRGRQRGGNLAVRHERAVDGGPLGWVARGPWWTVFVPRGRSGSRRGRYALCDHQGCGERGEKGECDVHFEYLLSKAKGDEARTVFICVVVPSPD